jgi:hypothetical protein
MYPDNGGDMFLRNIVSYKGHILEDVSLQTYIYLENDFLQ